MKRAQWICCGIITTMAICVHIYRWQYVSALLILHIINILITEITARKFNSENEIDNK